VLLAVSWIGLRFGRAAAWLAIVVTALCVLPRTAGLAALDATLALHMGLSAVAVVGYLAGSLADADIRARADLARRDRLLFQAERLKTLRAMSVSVIHEISQPLSTLAIEARHLAEISASPNADRRELHDGAQLIERKTVALATLVRRLRRFGGRAVDSPSPLPVATLLDTVAALVRPEARAAKVTLTIAPGDLDLVVLAQEVELAQAIVNLVRNAVQATADGTVGITAERLNEGVRIMVSNARTAKAAPNDGMGVGLLVARTIIEAHGGGLRRADHPGAVTQVVTLPLAEELA
jgi:C4-dicarboxylate-specific signal transduction histidine kinase